MTTIAPTPSRWVTWMRDLFNSGKPPPLGTLDLDEIEERAKKVLTEASSPWAYWSVKTGAGLEWTQEDNHAAFRKWKLIPRALVNAGVRNLETELFGIKYPSPVLVAPVGNQGMVHPEAELATARAAAKVGVPLVLSNGSTRSLEDIAAANGPGGRRWFQLYWPRTEEISISILSRAKANGFSVLVITVDTMMRGWRPYDNGTPYLPAAHGFGVSTLLADPVFMARHGLEPRHEQPAWPFVQDDLRAAAAAGDAKAQEAIRFGAEWGKEMFCGAFRTWEDLEVIKKLWDGPVVLKGILAVDDAEKAIDIGVDGIVVSNHGGRQVDGAIPALDALATIMASKKVLTAQRTGKMAILFDSGIRTGSDIIKALALECKVLNPSLPLGQVGRPFMYGLAIAGDVGVEQILMQTLCDLDITLGLCGLSDVKDLVGQHEKVLIKS
ncbi:oxidoreductase [Coniophora puteana RWD-64-598 SS2]|uniref:Oxidoreductase n=1 Tax=Coniophora puteana (strain RWD-64-598) TaxID=741705 RepID=A0A5M3M8B9_CONPW|nr:oxidoreductase [Coniophora puteana RWD-64-598 SS2]EIW75035.1 oxidoreductase [Coniophora puteana RWD-64-598 SS2]